MLNYLIKTNIWRSLFFSIFTLLLLNVYGQSPKTQIEQIDSICHATFEAWDSPGMAVSVVKDGEIIYANGFGLTDINSTQKVNKNTLFAIASNTKTFTATAIMMLQEQGVIDIDDKVVKYIHNFQLYDPYVSQNMSIRDLLCHRSGLKTFSGDLIWYGSNYNREEVIEKLRYLKPAYGFREHFGYSNILFLTAGQIIPAVTDSTWDKFIKYRLFNPLHMNRTISSTRDLKRMTNVASPHNKLDNDFIISIPWLNWDNIAPAGSIISSAYDMAQWIILQLNHGVYNNKRLFSEELQNEMWQMHTPTQVSPFSKHYWPDIHFKGYGLGWSLSDYAGKKIVSHNGGYDGMISQTVLIPEENIGFIVLTNSNTWLYMPMMYSLLDVLLDKKGSDWNNLFLSLKKRQETANKEARKDLLKTQNTEADMPLNIEDYQGRYNCEIYGETKITYQKNALWLNMTHSKIFSAKLEHFHYNTFLIKFKEVPSLPQGTVTFQINSKGETESLEIFIDNPDFDFTEFDFIKQ